MKKSNQFNKFPLNDLKGVYKRRSNIISSIEYDVSYIRDILNSLDNTISILEGGMSYYSDETLKYLYDLNEIFLKLYDDIFKILQFLFKSNIDDDGNVVYKLGVELSQKVKRLDEKLWVHK